MLMLHTIFACFCGSETGIWVTYKSGVYDVTKFAATHPGGNQILEAAGGPVDPFWDLYQQHDTPQVLELLETLRIGMFSFICTQHLFSCRKGTCKKITGKLSVTISIKSSFGIQNREYDQKQIIQEREKYIVLGNHIPT